MLTDNNILVNKLEPLPALMCAQRKAEKKISTDEDFVKSNIESFGNEIGQTTNWITSMFEVRSHYKKNSEEYEALSYRIKCGQLFQQNAIDKAKGIICKPMPKNWHDKHSVNKIEDEGTREFYRSIVADKKPYFMRYIYPALMKEYNTYINNTDRNSLREFQLTVNELKTIPEGKLTDRQSEFLRYYERKMPVGTGDCIMNIICRKFEKEFDGYISKHNASTSFDYTIMKCTADYTAFQFNSIKKLYDEYNKRIRNYMIFADSERMDEFDSSAEMSMMNDEFRRECYSVCPDKDALCNIILDLCYKRNSTKRFAWSMCGHDIIHNLLKNNEHTISFPTADIDGDIKYCGETFSVVSIKMGEEE